MSQATMRWCTQSVEKPALGPVRRTHPQRSPAAVGRAGGDAGSGVEIFEGRGPGDPPVSAHAPGDQIWNRPFFACDRGFHGVKASFSHWAPAPPPPPHFSKNRRRAGGPGMGAGQKSGGGSPSFDIPAHRGNENVWSGLPRWQRIP